jgi:signal transduction histidine kinase
MKLAIRIISVSFFSILVTFGAAIYIRVQTTYGAFEARQRAVAERVATAMTDPLREVWQADGTRGVDRLVLEENRTNHDGGPELRWVWFDAAASSAKRPHLPVDQWPSLDDKQPVSITRVDESRRRRLHTYITVHLASDRHGGLELTEPLEPLDRLTWRRMQIDLAAFGAAVVVFMGIAYATGIFWVVRPLQSLIAKTQRIAQGDFASPLILTRRDELGDLASALNDMSSQLAEQRAAIEAATEQRLAALEQLRHADRLNTVGRLAAGIAHELGTPLNVIAGRAALINSGRVAASEVQSSAATIKAEADRIAAIVRHLLDFARQRRLHREVCDLHALAVQVAEILRPVGDQKNVRIEVASGAGTVKASIDASQVQQVLINLLTNAIDALPEGGQVCVEVGGDASEPSSNGCESSFTHISVSDDGTGIPEGDLEHVFEPFFTTKDIGRGTGLGLSIAYGIVQEHGGRIEVASKLGKGTRFTIYLPSESVI